MKYGKEHFIKRPVGLLVGFWGQERQILNVLGLLQLVLQLEELSQALMLEQIAHSLQF